MKILETERLILRQVSIEDADFMLELLKDPSFISNIADRGVRTVDAARTYITERMISSYEKFGFGIYLVTLKESNTPIGICGLVKRDTLKDIDIGYAFLPAYWLKGYATESVLAIKEYAKNTVGLKRIAGIVAPDNQGSIRVLEKAGLKYKKMVKLSENDIDLKLYKIDLYWFYKKPTIESRTDNLIMTLAFRCN